MKITIHSFTTPHKENFTDEYELSKAQAERMIAFKDDWKHSIFTVVVDGDVLISDLTQTIKSRTSAPSYDIDGADIFYVLLKVNDANLLNSIPSQIMLVGWFFEIGTRLTHYETLTEQNIKDGDILIFCPGIHAGPPDPLTIIASIATVAQLFLMIFEMWRQRKRDLEVPNRTLADDKHRKYVEEIRVCMEDGSWLHIKDYYIRPNTITGFVEKISRFGSSIKPDYAMVIFSDSSKFKIKLTTSVDRENLNELLELFEWKE